MIKTQIIAHLGGDAVVNNVNGKNVINFSAAHTEKYKNAQGVAHEKVLWVRCAYWVDKIAIAPYLKKGTLIFCEGQPEVSTYQDKQGKWQAEFKLRVGQIQLLGGQKENSGGNGQPNQSTGHPQQLSGGTEYTDEELEKLSKDLPF